MAEEDEADEEAFSLSSLGSPAVELEFAIFSTEDAEEEDDDDEGEDEEEIRARSKTVTSPSSLAK